MSAIRLINFRVVIKDESEERIDHRLTERGPLILRNLESTMEAHGFTPIKRLGGNDLPVESKVIKCHQ